MLEFLLFFLVAAVAVTAMFLGVPGLGILILLAVLVLGAQFLRHYLRTVRPTRRRAAALAGAAAPLGLVPDTNSSDPFAVDADFNRYQLELLRNPGRAYRNVLRGTTAGGETLVFDFRCTDGSEEPVVLEQTVVAWRVADAELPRFSIRPKGTIERLGAALSKQVPERLRFLGRVSPLLDMQDITFASHPRFSEQYLLQGPNESAVRTLFQPAVLDAWESFDAKERWCADGAERWVIMFRDRTLVAPEELSKFLARGEAAALALRAARGSPPAPPITPPITPPAGARSGAEQ